MWFFGDKRGQDLIDKVRALHSQDMVKDVLTQLYADLSTLDSKASGLLTVDGLFVAILSLYPSLNVIGDAKTRARITVLIDLQLVLAVGQSGRVHRDVESDRLRARLLAVEGLD